MSTREPETDGLAAEAAQYPPSAGEKLYAEGEGRCNCHISGPCNLCSVLNETEINICAQDGIEALYAHWDDAKELRKRLQEETCSSSIG